MKRYFHRAIALILTTALLSTSGGAAEAYTAMVFPLPVIRSFSPQVVRSLRDPAFFTEQAMVESLISQHLAPAKESLGRLFLTYLEPIHEWSHKPVHKAFPRIKRGVVAAVVITALVTLVNAHYTVPTGLLTACGNFVAIVKVKNSELKIDLNNIEESLEPGIKDLVNRGVYSFGFSFQIPVLRKIPAESQLPGFKEDREVIVWEFQSGKVLLDKREDALESAKQQIKYQIKEGLAKAAYVPDYLMLSFHSRLGSVGTDKETLQELEEAAQPGLAPPRGAREDFEIRFEPIMETDQGFFTALPPDYRMHVQIPGLGGVEARGAPPEVLSGQVKAKMHMGWRYVKADFQYQMNGDLSGIKGMNRNAPKEDIGNQIARERLTTWFGYNPPLRSLMSKIWNLLWKILVYSFTFWKPDGSVSPGDAPIQAMYFKMNYALRMPLAAIRYAFFTHVFHPGEARYKTPPFQLMTTTNLFVAQAFRYWSQNKPEVAQQWFAPPVTNAEAEAAVQAKMRQAEDFASYLRLLLTPSVSNLKTRHDFLNDPSVNGTLTEIQLQSIVQELKPEELDALLREASLAFWRNGIQYATLREIKPRVEDKGTQAADYNTVIEPTIRMTTANGQSLVGAVGPQNAAIASDRIVILAEGEALGLEKMIKIDSSANESTSMEVKREGVRVSLYRGVSNTPMTPQDIQNKRLANIKDSDNPEEPAKDLPPLQGMEAGVRRSAIQMARVHQSWLQVRQGYKNARNQTPITELTRVRMQLPIYEVLLTQLFKKNLPIRGMDSWAWAQADALSRAIWKKPELADRLIQDINALVDREAQTRAPVASTTYVDLKAMLPKYHGVYVATGKTYLALKKSAQSLNRSLGTNILVLDGGKLLKIVNKYSRRDPATQKPKLDVDGLLRELGVNRHVPWLLASDSGAETYEINILSAVAKVVTEEPFGISGTNRNHLVDQFGKNRVLTTENYGSKDQDSTAAFLSMVQTLQEADLWATENITRRFKTGGPDWDNNPFFKTEFTNEEVTQMLIPSNDQVVQDVPARLLGYTANGVALDTTPRPGNDAANIRQAGLWNAERDLEGARLWLVVKTYVIVTVAGAAIGLTGLGHYLPRWLTPYAWAIHGLDYLGWPGHMLSAFWMSLPIFFTHAAPFIDAAIYVGLFLGLLFLKRAIFLRMGWSNTKVLDGWGLPTTLFVSSEDWLHDALADQGWVGEGLAYIMLKSTYLSANLGVVNDIYRAAANRNTQAIIFRPGADHEAFEFDDQSADQAGRHLKTQVSMPLPHGLKWLAKFLRLRPVSPKVIHAGTHTAPAPDDNWGLMARTVDETIGKLPLVVPPGKKFIELPYHVAEYYLEQEVNLALYLQGVRRQATRADKRAKGVLGFFRYKAGAYLGGYAVKSTRAPSPGEKPLSAAERAALEMPLRMVAIADHSQARPKVPDHPAIETAAAEWHAWPQSADWLEGAHETAQEFNQSWREITEQPDLRFATAAPELASVSSKKSGDPAPDIAAEIIRRSSQPVERPKRPRRIPGKGIAGLVILMLGGWAWFTGHHPVTAWDASLMALHPQGSAWMLPGFFLMPLKRWFDRQRERFTGRALMTAA